MRAVIRTTYGGPEVLSLKNVKRPVPKPKELLIRVHATTINRTDCGLLTGKPLIIRLFVGLRSPKHSIGGTDFAGEVIGIGSEVSNFELGDRVWGFNDEGLQSHAEYMVINETVAVAKIPDDVSYEHAAASAEGAHYALNFINKVRIKTGDKVLVNGATGAIGSATVQILKYYNCKVTAVVNTKNIEMIKSLGVDKIYNWEQEDFTQDEDRYDFVCDSVGKSTFGKCKHLLKDRGIYVSSELGPGGENVYLPLLTLFSKKQVKFPLPMNTRRSILFINRLMREGKFKSVIDRHYKMDEIPQAYKYVMTGQKTGNVILKIQ